MMTLFVFLIFGLLLISFLYRMLNKTNNELDEENQSTSNNLSSNEVTLLQVSEIQPVEEPHVNYEDIMEFEYDANGSCIARINKTKLFQYVIQQLKELDIIKIRGIHYLNVLLGSLYPSDFEIVFQQSEYYINVQKDAPLYNLQIQLKEENIEKLELKLYLSEINVVVYAPMDGYLEDGNYSDGSNHPLFRIIHNDLYQNRKSFIEDRYLKYEGNNEFIHSITEDLFNKSICLKWDRVANRVLPNEIRPIGKYYNAIEMADSDGNSLYISLQVKNNAVGIVFSTNTHIIRISSGDEISLSFRNEDEKEHILNFQLTDDYVRDNYYGIYNISFFCLLNASDIKYLMDYNCLHWKINFNRNHKSSIFGNNSNNWTPAFVAPDIFRKYAKKFHEGLLELETKYNLVYGGNNANDSSKEMDSSCYVYLMFDTANGYYKIGISNKPEYRERTLQSEKPTIEKICAKKYPNRTIALAIESALHKSYDSKRLRGEWFSLDDNDVTAITATLS